MGSGHGGQCYEPGVEPINPDYGTPRISSDFSSRSHHHPYSTQKENRPAYHSVEDIQQFLENAKGVLNDNEAILFLSDDSDTFEHVTLLKTIHYLGTVLKVTVSGSEKKDFVSYAASAVPQQHTALVLKVLSSAGAPGRMNQGVTSNNNPVLHSRNIMRGTAIIVSDRPYQFTLQSQSVQLEQLDIAAAIQSG
ncbi:hypothetical protein BC939DRAFT_504054 [Gamsiella multidivaricata]|uniref:uncharacterized protein n=1 Tax=Gamsiella multidivaricata TaxID=101098 RepID=UPI00221F835B|nr:uncharacterized protein BC939DRAFT_504054 [Gamsiella multidivaricata]KAI7822008.1 hypothetical protein BC939DRAFT_504054 [Gamsiella multidivaricata]